MRKLLLATLFVLAGAVAATAAARVSAYFDPGEGGSSGSTTTATAAADIAAAGRAAAGYMTLSPGSDAASAYAVAADREDPQLTHVAATIGASGASSQVLTRLSR